MTTVDTRKDFITWTDVVLHTRYLEQGYGVRLVLKMVVASPKGEQQLKQYYEYVVCDTELREVALKGRLLGSFPNGTSRSVPAVLLGMLFSADGLIAESFPWVEPTIAAKPRTADM